MFFYGGQKKGHTSVCAKAARGPDSEQGSWVSQQATSGQDGSASARGLESRRPPDVKAKDRRKEQSDERFLRGSPSAPLNICSDINEVILSRRREELATFGGTLFSDGQPNYPNVNTHTGAPRHGAGNKITSF